MKTRPYSASIVCTPKSLKVYSKKSQSGVVKKRYLIIVVFIFSRVSKLRNILDSWSN